jgi:hypothetical protein
VISAGGKANLIVADLVHQPMFVGDPPRPAAGA